MAAKTTRAITGKIPAFLKNWEAAATAKAVTDAVTAEIRAFQKFERLGDYGDCGEMRRLIRLLNLRREAQIHWC